MSSAESAMSCSLGGARWGSRWASRPSGIAVRVEHAIPTAVKPGLRATRARASRRTRGLLCPRQRRSQHAPRLGASRTVRPLHRRQKCKVVCTIGRVARRGCRCAGTEADVRFCWKRTPRGPRSTEGSKRMDVGRATGGVARGPHAAAAAHLGDDGPAASWWASGGQAAVPRPPRGCGGKTRPNPAVDSAARLSTEAGQVRCLRPTVRRAGLPGRGLRVALVEAHLVPVGVDRIAAAGGVEHGHLL